MNLDQETQTLADGATVGDLMEALSQLPPDTPIVEARFCGAFPIQTGDNGTLFTAKMLGDGRVKLTLIIYDGMGYYPNKEEHWEPLL